MFVMLQAHGSSAAGCVKALHQHSTTKREAVENTEADDERRADSGGGSSALC